MASGVATLLPTPRPEVLASNPAVFSATPRRHLEIFNWEDTMFTIADYSLITSYVRKYGKDNNVEEDAIAFYFFILDLVLKLTDDEVRDSITDNYYLKKYGNFSGHDRGIDAIYVDSEADPKTVHFFNFKYASTYKKTAHFIESGEIDKIEVFLNKLMTQDFSLKDEINMILYSKVEEIWEIFTDDYPKFVFHIATNYQNSFTTDEKLRFERCINKYTNFEIDYILADKIVNLITKKNRKRINARIKAIDTNLFNKIDGDIRALIVNFDARDILRIISNNEDCRNDASFSDFKKIKDIGLADDAFEDNVRLYLKKETTINANIFETALSDDNYKFFYYNNGITLTCDHFSYPSGMRNPIIEIENLQIVNGGQTLHALSDALEKDPDKLSTVNILCRLYETQDKDLSSRIAEFTNSQNPVNNRDIHSIDILQIKLEREFFALGFFYERKKNQFTDKPKNKRIDAEKMGQAVLAFYGEKPSEAKNEKRKIFADFYNDIFNINLRAGNALIAYKLYEFVEGKKSERKRDVVTDYENKGYISYCTYWVLYIIHQISSILQVEISEECFDGIMSLYLDIINILQFFVNCEKEERKKKESIYTHGQFFKYNAIKKYWEQYISTSEFAEKKVMMKKYFENKTQGPDNA
jgi:hypothetical protein